MIIVVLVVFGLCLGSFVNALVWRVHEQAKQELPAKSSQKARHVKLVLASMRPNKLLKQYRIAVRHKTQDDDLSIIRGRSMCPNCHHALATRDLIPVLSWLSLRGKCRYCHKSVSAQYPLVELATAATFVASYIWWPQALHGAQIVIFGLWLLIVTGLMALLVYDLRWYLLPNRIMYPLGVLAVLLACVTVSQATHPWQAVLGTVLGVLVGGGIFYLLFQVSGGRWIGGGDVKLGWLLGLIVATPARALLLIFLAALGGSLISLPLLAGGRLKRSSLIPFGPFLIVAAVVVQLFGGNIIHWYQHVFLNIGS